ncbi:DUF1643 domain-containing protein [Paenibacillus sp. FA6]|uniref:DUF1643 domain-containing protein n=1 Tax=Paenibacillus sp. FA6 TaxID=3413029 RepID=UPI003F6575B2
MKKDALIDVSQKYRYWLSRHWDSILPSMTYIMLNPSTADANNDDPTIRRCISFAQNLGYGSLEVVNLFAFRATNPRDLLTCEDPIGTENDKYIMQSCDKADLIVAAWGVNGVLKKRNTSVENLVAGSHDIHCLGKPTVKGHPRHPLFIKGNTQPMIYRELIEDIV